jgi:hypothetical protein
MPREPIGFSLWNARPNDFFPASSRVVNRGSVAMGSVSSRALEEESPACLASQHSHWFRFYPVLPYLSTFLHPFAPRALPRFLATMGALTPAQVALRTLTRGNEHPPYARQVSLVHTARPSMHSVTNHPVCPAVAFLLPLQRDRHPSPTLYGSGFTLNEEARRTTRPNRVRYPTDCMFASGCSPPHLAVTQLPSATGIGHNPGGGLAPPKSCLLPGALIPAKAGIQKDAGFRVKPGMTISRKFMSLCI